LRGSTSFAGSAVRHDKRADIHAAFLSLGCAWICWQALGKNWMTA
jgi:hypothetical protein